MSYNNNSHSCRTCVLCFLSNAEAGVSIRALYKSLCVKCVCQIASKCGDTGSHSAQAALQSDRNYVGLNNNLIEFSSSTFLDTLL